MDKHDLEKRTMQFALKVIAFVATLPKNKAGDVVGYQLVKAGTSVGANYREANRGESRNDFIHKIGIVEKEAAESQYRLDHEHSPRRDSKQVLCNEATPIKPVKQARGSLGKSQGVGARFENGPGAGART